MNVTLLPKILCTSKIYWIKCCQMIALVGCCSTDLQDEEEDVNDINVERERAIDVLLRADGQLPIPDKELSVVH